MEEAKSTRTTERRRFNRAVKLFNQNILQDDSTEILKTAFNEVCSTYRKLEIANDYLINCLKETDEGYETQLATAEDYNYSRSV